MTRTYAAKRLLSTKEEFSEVLNYDADTGVFTWKTDRYRSVKAGQVAGSLSDGYIRIKTDGRRYFAHRIAWIMFYGASPAGDIDHINRNRSDNRISNLRDVSRSENQQNTLMRPRNTSGCKGVYKKPGRTKWTAQIVSKGVTYFLGNFSDIKQAETAYALAAASVHTVNPLAAI